MFCLFLCLLVSVVYKLLYGDLECHERRLIYKMHYYYYYYYCYYNHHIVHYIICSILFLSIMFAARVRTMRCSTPRRQDLVAVDTSTSTARCGPAVQGSWVQNQSSPGWIKVSCAMYICSLPFLSLHVYSNPPGSSYDIVAKQWYYTVTLGPKKLFPIHLQWEWDVCNSVDNFFEHPNCRKTTHFTIRIWFIRSDNIWKV